ncbi:acyl-CoA dehydrogenase [Myxococcota bacterium]|nr:acyl-CoA dehydrogenase [Myxococcota bacterium]
MILLDPKNLSRSYPDDASSELMQKTVDFFERKGKQALKEDDRNRVWYDDFLAYVKQERLFATTLTPAGYGASDSRWDTWRNCEFAEILGFYGLHYWYTWQVSVLGLGPIWMSENEAVKERTAGLLEEGGIFAFGLSERSHGADVYSTEMNLVPQGDGTYLARGEKYYIGNGNKAALVSTFGKVEGSDDYVFFVVDSQDSHYECKRNVVNAQSYVSNFALHDYPIREEDILSRGRGAWDSALNTVNVGKFNLGWASIGICTHAMYEAVRHAANRHLYGQVVTDFPHVKMLFTDAYARLVAMKLVALRAADYMRAAGPEDRRYLLYNPVVKMKVTTQGEDVINHMWDVIAAKGFESDMYFEMAARDIRALPKLEGTVHVNIALIVKFMPNFFFYPPSYEEVGRRDGPANDDFLFAQGSTRGLGQIRFHDYTSIFESCDLPNVGIFSEQIVTFKQMLEAAPPGEGQANDVDFLLAVGELFTLVVYAQLLLENARIYELADDLVDQIFDVLIRDFSRFALQLHGKPSSTDVQMEHCLRMIRKPAVDTERYDRIWAKEVLPLKDRYQMNS